MSVTIYVLACRDCGTYLATGWKGAGDEKPHIEGYDDAVESMRGDFIVNHAEHALVFAPEEWFTAGYRDVTPPEWRKE